MTNVLEMTPERRCELFLDTAEEEREQGFEAWRQLMQLRLRALVKRLLSDDSDIERIRFRAAELMEFVEQRLHGGQAQPILVQTFEGKLTEVDDQFATVEFEMDGWRQLRRFPRTKLAASALHVNQIMQLRCELSLAPPAPPLSQAEVDAWLKRRADRTEAQAKTKWPQSLLEDEP
jgi:hypothetical protein